MRRVLACVGAVLIAMLMIGSALPARASTPPDVAKYVFSPNPIAATGSLSAGQSVNFTLTAEDANGNAIPGATVYLAFGYNTEKVGGTIQPPFGTASVSGRQLSPTPQEFSTDSTGHLSISFTAPDALPSSYTVGDELEASNTSAGVWHMGEYSIVAGTTYTFGGSWSANSAGGVIEEPNWTVTVPAGFVPAGDALYAPPMGEGTGAWRSLGLPSGFVPAIYGGLSMTVVTPDEVNLLFGTGPSLGKAFLATANYGPYASNPDLMSMYERLDGTWRYLPSTVDAASTTVAAYVYAPGTVMLMQNVSHFSDISSSSWSTPYINRLLAANVIDGFPNGTFQPDAPLTHAQFIKMLVVTLGLPLGSGSTPFSDVPADAWYAPYVGEAAEAGLTTNLFTTSFSPDAATTREQMAVLLARGLHLNGSSDVTFSDASQIAPWALPSVQAAVAAGYMYGFPDGTFRPTASLTRAQAAKVLALAVAHMAPQPTAGSGS